VVRWQDGQREGLHMRWGLVPGFARGVPPRYSTINATQERLQSGACWRLPWRRAQRCVLIASGFFEWHVLADGRKQPYYIRCADQPMFGFAGLWDSSRAADGTEILSCTLITLPANPLMAEIHNTRQRMPAILAAEDLQMWLSGSVEDAHGALRAYPADAMVAHPVSTRVNSPRQDDAQLLQAMDP
jgi:putative SOS response-associated peptidase YedK